jgi:N-acetylmuramoyl-L-alanine amidase
LKLGEPILKQAAAAHRPTIMGTRHATMPALLFEAGVVVNREEETRMSDIKVQKQIAAGVADGIDACLRKDEG